MKNLMGALMKAQAEFDALHTDASNPAYKSRYATLAAVQEAAFPALRNNGLVVMQSCRTEYSDRCMVIVGATLHHVSSGEEVFQELALVPSKSDPQGIGSAITYGRRYLLLTMLGLVADDDDGNAASNVRSSVVGAGQGASNGAGRYVKATANGTAQVKPGVKAEAKPDARLAQKDSAEMLATLRDIAVVRYGSLEAWESNYEAAAAQWASNDRTSEIGELSADELQRILDGWAKKDAQKKK